MEWERMSIKIISQVWEDKDLTTPVEIAVMLALADFSNDAGKCWPSLPTICRKSRCCRGTVYAIIQRMVKIGKLTYTKGGGSTSNHYQFNQTIPVHVVNGGSSSPERPPVHVVNNTRSRPEPDPSGSVSEPPNGVSKASPATKNKDSSEVYLLNQALEIASPAAKKELTKKKKDVLGQHFKVDLNLKPINQALSGTEPPTKPADDAAILQAIMAAHTAVNEAPTVQPIKQVLRQIRHKRPQPNPQNPHPV